MEVIEENRSLHAELKRSVVDEIVRTSSVQQPVITMPTPAMSVTTQPPASHVNHHIELVMLTEWRCIDKGEDQ